MTFIALEGGEGVGKTTQMKLLTERLPALYPDREFVFTREPGGTEFGEKTRELILSDNAKDADGKTMFGLFAAARADHMRRVILPALAAGKVVVTDRFVGSSYAYQMIAQDGPIETEVFQAHCLSLEVLPDLSLVMDMDPAISQARIQKRRATDTNHFDSRGIEFHEHLQNGYRMYAESHTGTDRQACIIWADNPVEDVHKQILRALTLVL